MPVLRSEGANGAATVTQTMDSECGYLFMVEPVMVEPVDIQYGVQPREYHPCRIQYGIDSERNSGGRFGESGNCLSCGG
jgi:hypothetical protein